MATEGCTSHHTQQDAAAAAECSFSCYSLSFYCYSAEDQQQKVTFPPGMTHPTNP
jgi:hypothetical protein